MIASCKNWIRGGSVLALLVGLGLLYFFGIQHKAAPGARFIVVTGISSSGKSSTVDVLRKMLGDDCVVVRLDDYIQRIVEAKARELAWNEHNSVGPMEFLRMHFAQDFGHAVFDYEIRATFLDYTIFYDAIRAAGAQHKYVCVDTIVESSRCRQELEQVVGSGADSLWVLLYCPLQTIAHRLHQRANMASFVSHGISLATYESFLAMYTISKGEHWTPIDSLNARDTRVLLDTSINTILVPVPYDKLMAYKERLDVFRKRFLREFGLDHAPHAVVPIYPAQRHDLVVDSDKKQCEEIAHEIQQALMVRQ